MSVDKLQSTSSALEDFDDAELEQLYTWIDSIPLSRPKKNIARDFSDGGKIYYHGIFDEFFEIMIIRKF